MRTANENVLRVLARAMADARAGGIEAVAIVAVGPGGQPDPMFGGEAELMPSVNIGLDMLKQQILFHVIGGIEQQPTTSIVRPAS
jgi:hypothetical protein